MGKVERSRELNVSADTVWAKIGDFHDVGWLPGVESVEKLDDQRRKLGLGGGMAIVERLIEQGDRSQTYTMDDTPLPVQNYRSVLSVRETGEGTCAIDWVGTFDVDDGTPEEMGEQIIGGVYDAGLNAIEEAVQ